MQSPILALTAVSRFTHPSSARSRPDPSPDGLRMKIDAVDFYYLAMPEITTEVDGSQDALLVRVGAGGLVGWGECEASPLVSIAAFVTPMSHGVCRPVAASVLGQSIDGPADIA